MQCFLDGYAIADKSIPLATYRAARGLVKDMMKRGDIMGGTGLSQ